MSATDNTMRAEFEAWVREYFQVTSLPSTYPPLYDEQVTQGMWQAWQAARADQRVAAEMLNAQIEALQKLCEIKDTRLERMSTRAAAAARQVAEAVAAEREAVNERIRLFAVQAKGLEAKTMALAIFHAMKGRAFEASQHSKPDREPSEDGGPS